MIFYFSGTGNSRRIALRLAGLTADKAVDIVSLTDIPDPKTERRIDRIGLSGLRVGAARTGGELSQTVAGSRLLHLCRGHLRRRCGSCA